jgi:hypothetical protein
VPEKANKTAGEKLFNIIEAASGSKSKFKRPGMKVIRHVHDPEHIADEFGDTSVANSRY